MIGWYLLLIFVALLFVGLHAFVFPKFFFKINYNHVSKERGVIAVNDPQGKSILYDPAPDLRAYIRQYILIGKGNAKQLVLRIDEGLRYIAYDVCLHDAHNNVFRVMKVRELIKKEGYTEPVDLPAETAYISLALSAVDGKKIRNELEGKITRKQWIMFALASVATDLLCVLVGKLCIGKIYGDIYWEGYVFAPSHWPAMCGICAAVIVINIAVTYLYIKMIVLKRGRR